MVSTLIALCLLCANQNISSPNLVANPDLAQDWQGWSPIWSRTEAAATAKIASGRRTDSRCIVVHSDDTKDWALSQTTTVPVKPRQLYAISGWLKAEGGNPSISVVARDEKDVVLEWELGSIGTARPGWNYVHRSFVIPGTCRSIQFRLTGSGVGTTSLEAPTLQFSATLPSMAIPPVRLATDRVNLQVSSDGSMAISSRKGRTWRYRAWEAANVIKSIHKLGPRSLMIDAIDTANDLPFSVNLQVAFDAPEVTMSYQSSGPMSAPLAAGGSLITEHPEWIVVPMNEGIRFPVEDATINNWSIITYGGHGLCMPWTGAVDPESGAATMTLLETPDDADVLFHQEGGRLTFQPRWESSRHAFGYKRSLRIVTFPSGGFVAMAKRYRAYAKTTGLFKSLSAKRKENPNIDRLIGAVNVWNWDLDKLSLCKEMKQLGFEHVLWSSGGTVDEVKGISQLGYLPGRYDIYQDVWDPKHSLSWQNTDGWPNDLVLESNGDWMKGWAHPDKHADGTITWYQGGVISSGAGLLRAKTKIPEDLKRIPYLARFIDTTTASPFREDYNPLHPLTRTEDRRNKMDLLNFCSHTMKLVTGTETGIDPSVPVVDYYEGMMSLGPFRLPDAGTFMMEYRKPTPEFLKYQVGAQYRIPLWELVYHDCTVAQWYWGDATNKAPEVWDQRDLLNILYGTAPLLMFDKDRWQRDKRRMLQTYKNVCQWVRKIGYDEMVSHQDLTGDHLVQKTTWSSGYSVTVNFGDSAYRSIPAKSFRIARSQ